MPKPKNLAKCTTPFCSGSYYARGLCVNCYRRWQRAHAPKTVSKKQMDSVVGLAISLLNAILVMEMDDSPIITERMVEIQELLAYASEHGIHLPEFMSATIQARLKEHT